MKINVNYFVTNSKVENVRYFLRRGHFFRLLWDRFKWHWFPRLGLVPSFPQTVDIETALSCQLKCPMCMREQMSEEMKRGIMSMDLFRKIVDECAGHNVFSVKLSWRGEPTLNPRLVDMVRYAKDKGIPDVAFLTNGGLIDRDMAEALVDAGLDWISFSIDGLGEDYERIRKPITFDEIVRVVTHFKEIKKARGADKPLVRIQTISSVIQDSPEYFDFWHPLSDRISVIAEQHREDSSLIRHDPNYVCQAPFQRIFITHDGRVVPCHGDYLLHHDMGNVGDVDIKDIWNSEKFRSFRSDMRNCRRLEHEGCRLCPDGGEYEADTLEAQGRTVKAIKYVNNERSESDPEQVRDEDREARRGHHG